MKTNAMDKVLNILQNGNCTTAHMIARVTGYTPQHINRCLKHLFREGKVAYAIVPHRGRAKQKRKWVAMSALPAWENVYPFETPEYIQREMFS